MISSQQLKFICNLTTFTHEPYHPPFTLSSYISHHFIYHHFPHCRVTNIQSSQTCHSYLILLVAFFLLLTSDFIQFSSHMLVSNHFILPLRTVSASLFTSFINHLPYSHASIFISFINHMIIIINMPLKQTHSSFSIILCPHLIASLSYFFLFVS